MSDYCDNLETRCPVCHGEGELSAEEKRAVEDTRAQLTTQSASLAEALERAERAERALAVCARAGCPSAAGFLDSASAGAVMTYPALCDCGRGKGMPHATGCAALTDSGSAVKP